MTAAPTFSFHAETHEYRVNGRAMPYVTGILENLGVIDYYGVDRFTLERKGLIGSIVHSITEQVDRDGLPYELATGMVLDEYAERIEGYDISADHVTGYLNAHAKFMAESKFQAELVEFRTVATVNGMAYGMTADRSGMLQKKPTILDFKCTAACEPWWPVQLSGYALGMPKPKDIVRWERAMVWLKPDGNYSLMPGGRMKTDHITEKRDEEVFLAALRISYWRLENLGRVLRRSNDRDG